MFLSSSAAQTGRSSHHHKREHGSKQSHQDTRSDASSKAQTTPSNEFNAREPPFLFVVNEFVISCEPLEGDLAPLRDQWGNIVPPVRTEAYGDERVGTVFRYGRDGSVRVAEGYRWWRPQPHRHGRIVKVDNHGNIIGCAETYKETSIFACSPQLPLVTAETDASTGASFLRKNCGCDGQYDEENSPYRPWSPLFFTSWPCSGAESMAETTMAVSRISRAGDQCVAGNRPSWIPALVPRCYTNTRRTVEASARSYGLGGDLGIIIGLMAFHSEVGNASQVFQSGLWRANEWRGSSSAPRYPSVDDDPRGFLVHVALDNLEHPNVPTTNYTEFLQALEWWGVMAGVDVRYLLESV
ncbi:hypothetical protein GQ53DRAFT_766275 [Thozetella sp. PMI_491]|nr:hypothetical protein GQ53DRAFT_766275 [Thozetella sp. PMI_491]